MWLLTQEGDLASGLSNTIDQFFESAVKSAMWITAEGISLHYSYLLIEKSQRTIVLSSGRGECALKYKELFYNCYQNNMSLFVLDHRGQGFSQRLTDNVHHGYVKNFDDYVSDFEQFMTRIVKPLATSPLMLLSHSMGGAIAALYLLKYPSTFRKAVFCAPMFGIALPIKPNIAHLIVKMKIKLNQYRKKSSGYFFGQTNYYPVSFSKNRLTTSAQRYEYFRQTYSLQPIIQVGGATSEWLSEAIKASLFIQQHVGNINTPALVIIASLDTIIDNAVAKKAVSSMPQANLLTIDDAKHELLFESDDKRNKTLVAALDFFGDHK